MKHLILILIILAGCKTQQVYVPVKKIQVSNIVYKIDTIVGTKCLYSVFNYVDSVQTGQGSIITKCGCFNLNEEANPSCYTSQ